MRKIKAAVLALLLALCVFTAPASASSGGVLPAVPPDSANAPDNSQTATGFDDVPENAWFAAAALWCRDHGLMNGTAPRVFSPNLAMTRAMAAAVLYRMQGSPQITVESAFADVPDWCRDAVSWAARTGVTAGYDETHFGPNDPVTRQQMAVFLWRYSGKPAPPSAEPFADEEEISAYAVDAVHWAKAVGAVSGYSDGRFNPKGRTSRAHMAQILMNYATRAANLITPAALSELNVLCAPSGIAAMEDGSLLVTDSFHKVIWQVRDGVSTLFAGSMTKGDLYGIPVGGFRDGPLQESLFRCPWAIAPFLDGWAVSDAENHVIRLLSPSGVRTLNPGGASQQQGENSAFRYPTGLTTDNAGNLYVSDTHSGVIWAISSSGSASAVASGLNDPMGLCWHEGSLYAAETGANRIVRIVGGRAEAAAGTGQDGMDDGPAMYATFACPQGIATDGQGTLYVSDTANGAIRRIRGGVVTTVAAHDQAKLESCPISPVGLLIREHTLYICDQFSKKVFCMAID